MTFSNAVELWEYQHPTIKFMDAFTIHAFVDKDTLIDYLLYDYGNLRIVETNSDAFHDMVDNFFKIHKWNIDKQADSMNFKYDPINNTDWKQVQDYDRGQDFDSTTDRDVSTDRDMTVDRDINTDRTESIDTVKKWDEKGSSDETDKHFVSAYNDDNRDTPKSRDTIEQKYEKSGNETTNVDDVENTKTTDVAVTEEDIKTAEDVVKNEKTKEQIDLVITRKGHDGNVSYQSLIEEERKQAQFNLYKWIGNHFANELLICLW